LAAAGDEAALSEAGIGLRDREAIAVDLIGVVGLAALAAGLLALQTSKEIGFDVGAAVSGTVAQLSVTLPAALLVLAAAGLELAAGLVVARLARRVPFESLTEAAIASLVATTLKGALLIGLLGGFGLYRGPILIAIDVLILVWGRWLPFGPRVGRVLAAGWTGRIRLEGSRVVWALVAIVWAGPILLQLASPVVPFIDVLPNYVGPAEHLRTFGWLSPLTETQSPIIGPSRSVMGYDALLGGVTTMTNLPAVLAVSAYILPSALLVAAGVQRLANALTRGDAPVGPWALLGFAATESFARMADARGTVIVLPLVCFALALAAERYRRPGGDVGDEAADEEDAWRPSRGLAIGLGLGAAVLVHPVVGAFAIATVAVLALIRPDRLAPDAGVAGLTAAIVAAPQLGVMLGQPVPPLALAAALALALAVGIAAARAVADSEPVRDGLVRLALWTRPALALIVAIGLAFAAVRGLLLPGQLPGGIGAGVQLLLDSCGILLVALALGWLVGSAGARSAVIYVTAAVGFAAVVLTQLLPGNLGFLGDALRFEVPKTVHYWIPVFVSIGAGAGLAKAVADVPHTSLDLGGARLALPWAARVVAVGAIVAFAAYPYRDKPIDAYHLGEHRLSEAVAIDLHYAASGFWLGFPDSRTLVDPPRQEIVAFIRGEIDAGRITHATPILHVAKSFQEWVSTPLGVFDGVTETFASPDQEVSHQTAGGRLYNLDDLHGLISGGTFPYVVLEPNDFPPAEGIRTEISAAGYHSIFANSQGEVFVRP
jgi:hypothetical protein